MFPALSGTSESRCCSDIRAMRHFTTTVAKRMLYSLCFVDYFSRLPYNRGMITHVSHVCRPHRLRRRTRVWAAAYWSTAALCAFGPRMRFSCCPNVRTASIKGARLFFAAHSLHLSRTRGASSKNSLKALSVWASAGRSRRRTRKCAARPRVSTWWRICWARVFPASRTSGTPLVLLPLWR